MFDSIAPEYDAFNHLTSLGIDHCWRQKALRFIKGPKVLDLACGTGDFSIAIARGLQGVHVTGIDISDGMLAEMKLKLAKAGLETDSTPLNSKGLLGSDSTPLAGERPNRDACTFNLQMRPLTA